jgi:hypothetical protein
VLSLYGDIFLVQSIGKRDKKAFLQNEKIGEEKIGGNILES